MWPVFLQGQQSGYRRCGLQRWYACHVAADNSSHPVSPGGVRLVLLVRGAEGCLFPEFYLSN